MIAELNQTWQRVTAPGQVKVGTKIRFMLGDELRHETAKLILHAGTDKEEVIYNKRRNWYFITSMAMAGTGSQKNIEFLGSASTANTAAATGEREAFEALARSRGLDLSQVQVDGQWLYSDCNTDFAWWGFQAARATPSAISKAEAGDKPVAWLLRIGDSDSWSFTESEDEADFYGKQSGQRYVKEPLYRTPPTHTAAVQAALERAVSQCLINGKDAPTAEEQDMARYCALSIRAIKPEDVLEGGK